MKSAIYHGYRNEETDDMTDDRYANTYRKWLTPEEAEAIRPPQPVYHNAHAEWRKEVARTSLKAKAQRWAIRLAYVGFGVFVGYLLAVAS